jgi:hypothetical protein
MQARTETLIAAGALLALVGVATALGSRSNSQIEEDPRPSSFLAGPYGARGLAQERMGLRVRRFRYGFRRLEVDTAGGSRSAFVLLDPTQPLRAPEVERLRAWNDSSPRDELVLVGRGAADGMRCYGYTVDWRYLDSLELRAPIGSVPGLWPRVAGVLASATDTLVADSSRMEDVGVARCAVPAIVRADTLLTATTGRVVVLRLVRRDGGAVIAVSDPGIFRNRALRATPAGPFALGLFAGRYTVVTFEEAHHGFEEGGSLAGAVLDWSRRSPLGWAMWQVSLVGALALLAGAVRFGPVRRVLVRKRRSPLEHVRALATALAAARGHDVAIAAIIEGLRRRLQPTGQRTRGDWRPWLEHLGEHVRSPRARKAVATLRTLTRPGQSPAGVLKAANAVEDVWEELRP